MIHVVLAAAARVPLGNGCYLLAINYRTGGDNPDAPLLHLIAGALQAQDRRGIDWLRAQGAQGIAEASSDAPMSFLLPRNRLREVREWFQTGLDREPYAISRILRERVPGVDFGGTELVGMIQDERMNPDGAKTVTLLDVMEAAPTGVGFQHLEALLRGGSTHVAVATTAEICNMQLTHGGIIDNLAAEALQPQITC